MHELDNEKFGVFLALLRKEKGMTQKDLAEKLYISDKAVSKWERGLSMPDVALLPPLSELLGVTIAELLKGERVSRQMDLDEVEELVSGSLNLSDRGEKRKLNRWWAARYAVCALVAAAELLVLWRFGYKGEMWKDLLLVEGFAFGFGAWFCLFAREKLPAYYDGDRIGAISDGIFRMNLPGVRFNNSNWPHILNAGRVSMMAVSLGFPPLYLFTRYWFFELWEYVRLPLLLAACLSFVVPMMIAGKRYE